MYERGKRIFHLNRGYGTIEHTFHVDGVLTEISVTYDNDHNTERYDMHNGKPWRGHNNELLAIAPYLVDEEFETIIEALKHHA